MPHWMRVLSNFNPVNWGVHAARDVVLPGTDWGAVGTISAICSRSRS